MDWQLTYLGLLGSASTHLVVCLAHLLRSDLEKLSENLLWTDGLILNIRKRQYLKREVWRLEALGLRREVSLWILEREDSLGRTGRPI